MKKDILIAFSGGIDSFGMLFKLLETNEYNVHLYYYEIENNRRKNWCENHSLETIIKEINNKIENKIDYTFYNNSSVKLDIEDCVRRIYCQRPVWPFLLGYECLAFEFPYIGIGFNKDDMKRSRSPLRNRVQSFINSFWNLIQEDSYFYPEAIFPLEEMSKRDIILYLKEKEKEFCIDVLSQIWTCENPQEYRKDGIVGYKSCGDCIKCKELKENL